MKEAMRFQRTKYKKKLVETSTHDPTNTRSTLGRLSDGLGRATQSFNKAQGWATEHFQGTALDMETDIDTGLGSLNLGAADDLAGDWGLDSGRSHKKKKHKKK